MTADPFPSDPSPRWLRLSAVAKREGFDARMLAQDLADGVVPIRTATFGRREILFLFAPDVAAWRASFYAQPVPGAHIHETVQALR